MEWWQIVLFIVGSISAGILVGSLLSLIVRLLKKQFAENREMTTVVKEQVVKEQVVEEPVNPPILDLLAEVENNLKIASEPWTGKLLPFQTHAHERITNEDGVHRLAANLRDGLTRAYADIRLANGIVWLSTELGRRSDDLDEYYQKLCTNITTVLNTITPLLNGLGNEQYKAYHDGERQPVGHR